MFRRLVTVLVAALALAAAGCGDDEPTPEAALESFVQAIREADPSAACDLLGDQALTDLEVAGSCEKVMGEGMDLIAEKDVEIPDYEITDVSVDGDTAEATLRSDATNAVVPLVREDGEWKLKGASALSQIHPDSPLGSTTGDGG